MGGGVVLTSGWNNVRFPELPTPFPKPAWIPYDFNPADEPFCVYVPQSYDPNQACGIFAWNNGDNGGDIPRQFAPLLEKYRLIGVAASNCGHDSPAERRVGIYTSAALELQKVFRIDPSMRVISGVGQGGRTATLACYVHSDFWSGAISWSWTSFYRDAPTGRPDGSVWTGFPRELNNPDLITDQNIADIKSHSPRFVVIMGDQDQNLAASHAFCDAQQADGLQSLFIEQAGLGHATLGDTMNEEKGLQFVLYGKSP
jgi:hypothetical protein